MNARLMGEKLITAIRRDGLWTTLRFAALHLTARPTNNPEDGFDAAHGTDTGGIAFLWSFRVDSRNAKFATKYEATDERVLDQAVKFMPEDPGSLTFIDLGCGKGKALLLAWKLGFKKIVGVEFVSELANIAEANLRRVGASNAFVIHSDAAQFSFPDEDFVVYLFNPFHVEVMRKVVENLRQARATRRFVIYNYPHCAELFDSSGFLSRIGEVSKTPYPTIIWASAKQ
jgi:SAM-dependent methyltransferase